MKSGISFGKIFWPALTASVIVVALLVIFFSALFGSLLKGPKPFAVESNTVLHMTLSGPIGETSSAKINPTSFSLDNKTGLSALLFGLEKAAEDDNIKGLFIELDMPSCGYATASEIRKAINAFEEKGKFVITYFQGEAVGLKQYYIGSAANESYGFPTTMFEFGGLGAELMFYKGLFDKLDIEMQVIRGSNNDFKSAVEPYFRKSMSDSSRVQIERYLTSMWEDIRKAISDEKSISIEKLNHYADSTMIRRVSDAVTYGLINDVKYRDEVLNIIAEKIGKSNPDDLNLASFERYAQKKFETNQKIARGKDANIAVILAEGGVVKKGDGLSSDRITKYIRDARKDENIKAIVFRVNSPGGSALASDEIWREVMLAKAVKPVIVSMGDVAASGGYYVAAPATRIFAEPTTITGSIGVFGVIPYTGAMLENKLGVTFDRASTNDRAVLSTNKKMSPEEFAIVQEEVDFIYDQFLSRVAEGRGMAKEQVNTIARGRVWTGRDALKIGLVDELGGITNAIEYAAKEVAIEKPIIQYYPKVKAEMLAEILEAFEDQKEDNSSTESISEELLRYYEHIKALEQYTGIQARMPYEVRFY